MSFFFFSIFLPIAREAIVEILKDLIEKKKNASKEKFFFKQG